jgi:uncharacterized membrane protein
MVWLLAGYLLVTGIMTYFQKVAVVSMGWQTTLFWTWTTAYIINMVAVLPKTNFGITKYSLLGVGIGVCASFTTLIFYRVMEKYDVSRYVPIMGLYIVIPVILSAIFLKDHLSAQKVVGIGLAMAAIVLINWGEK